jgi:NTP pyrophosphatase (non-canonical NTP hydrolase)
MTLPLSRETASALAQPTERSSEATPNPLDVVVCGSFRREIDLLRTDVVALSRAGCRVLSPVDVDFVLEREGFVYADDDQHLPPLEIERRHLERLRSSDFVWLHAPNGYLGSSGAFELGIASMAGVPVFCREAPSDVTLRHFVTVVESPEVAASESRARSPQSAGAPLAALQAYYGRVASRRGWGTEGPAECMLLLTEEIGELARAVRQMMGLARDSGKRSESVGEELADVQLYLVHLANAIGVDLASEVTAKEHRNAQRVALRAVNA